MYVQKDSVARQKILNLTEFKARRPNSYVKRLRANPSKSLLLLQYEKPGVYGNFALVFPFGQQKAIDSLAYVYSVEWFTDSMFIYSKTNAIGRAGELRSHHTGTQKDSLRYLEKDPRYDIEVLNEGGELFCTVQSKTQNEIYWIPLVTHQPALKLIKSRQKGVMHTVKVENGFYMLVNDEEKGSRMEFAMVDTPDQWKTLSTSGKDDYIVDVLPLKDRLVALVHENSIPKLKYLKNGKEKWTAIKLGLGIGQFRLQRAVKDSVAFEFAF
ncbi:MAG: hypothetical protein AAF570_27270, partial [Bacteroidota bacterium]